MFSAAFLSNNDPAHPQECCSGPTDDLIRSHHAPPCLIGGMHTFPNRTGWFALKKEKSRPVQTEEENANVRSAGSAIVTFIRWVGKESGA